MIFSFFFSLSFHFSLFSFHFYSSFLFPLSLFLYFFSSLFSFCFYPCFLFPFSPFLPFFSSLFSFCFDFSFFNLSLSLFFLFFSFNLFFFFLSFYFYFFYLTFLSLSFFTFLFLFSLSFFFLPFLASYLYERSSSSFQSLSFIPSLHMGLVLLFFPLQFLQGGYIFFLILSVAACGYIHVHYYPQIYFHSITLTPPCKSKDCHKPSFPVSFLPYLPANNKISIATSLLDFGVGLGGGSLLFSIYLFVSKIIVPRTFYLWVTCSLNFSMEECRPWTVSWWGTNFDGFEVKI